MICGIAYNFKTKANKLKTNLLKNMQRTLTTCILTSREYFKDAIDRLQIAIKDQLQENYKKHFLLYNKNYSNITKQYDAQFFRRHRQLKKKQGITKITGTNNEILTEPNDIMETFYQYYQEQMKSNQSNPNYWQFFIDIKDRIPEANDIDMEMTELEIKQAINSLLLHRSPGPDGIGADFYYQYQNDLVPLLQLLFQNILQTQENLKSFTEGIIVLIPKNSTNNLKCKDWRPITLLNTDYKIMTKLITKKMEPIIHKYIVNTQSAGVKGRSISDSLLLLRYTVLYHQNKKIPLALVQLDQEKAFDRVDHEYMIHAIEVLGFPCELVSLITRLYQNASCRININFNISSDLPITTGVRQGCPLSMLLFVISLNTLLLTIDQNIINIGFQIPGRTNGKINYVAHADDITLVMTSACDVEKLLTIFKYFTLASNAKLNFDKSNYLVYGENRFSQLNKFINKVDTLKILGIFFGKNQGGKNAQLLFEKIKKEILIWETSFLNMADRVKVASSLLYSKIWYTTGITGWSKDYKKLEKLIIDYVWQTKVEIINRQNFYNSRSNGGWDLFNPAIFSESLVIRRIAINANLIDSPLADLLIYLFGIRAKLIDSKYLHNSRPIAFPTPKFISPYVKLMQEYRDKFGFAAIIPRASQIYRIYHKNYVPRVVTLESSIPWNTVWSRVHCPYMEGQCISLNWKIVQEAIPNKVWLYNLNITTNDKCPKCGQAETNSHIFYLCPQAKRMWQWIARLLQVNYITYYQIYYLINLPSEKWFIALWFCSNVKLILWKSRCERLFENKTMFTNYMKIKIKYNLNMALTHHKEDYSRVLFDTLWKWGENKIWKFSGDEPIALEIQDM